MAQELETARRKVERSAAPILSAVKVEVTLPWWYLRVMAYKAKGGCPPWPPWVCNKDLPIPCEYV